MNDSEIPPIILLQADHGPGLFTDFSSKDQTCLFERFSPLAAYYLFGLTESDLPADMSPVYLFRLILNNFDASLLLLEDAAYSKQDEDLSSNKWI